MRKILTGGLLILCCAISSYAQTGANNVVIGSPDSTVINKNIYGHFAEHLGSCIYGGIWVGEQSSIPNTRGMRNDVIAALKRIRVAVVRWPGGCFADGYHWMEGVGPREKRAKIVNSTWGGVVEDNSFGTHEFFDFCELIGAEPFICGNVGSGTVKEMSDWVQYITSEDETPMALLRKQHGREKPWNLTYWAVGNEVWGCGGIMSAEHYANELGRYSYNMKNYGKTQLYKIASGGLPEDYQWTETIMKKWAGVDGWLRAYMSGYSLHFYAVTDWVKKGSATNFTESEWFSVVSKNLEMDELIKKHSEIMDKYDPQKNIGLIVDEWGNWYDVEPGTNPSFLYQQNSMRDAVTAALNLNVFNNHADRVKMANIAQLVNVLQSLILTDGPKMVLTPTYHVFDMFKVHQDARLMPVKLETNNYTMGDKSIPAIHSSASMDGTGNVHVSLVNLHHKESQTVTCSFTRFMPTTVTGKILASSNMNDHNTFERPNVVSPKEFSSARISGSTIQVTLPPASVVVLELKGRNN